MRWAGWREVPRRARWTAGGYAGVLLYGTGVHVAHLLVGGPDPYPWAPGWLGAYFVSLTVADPLAAALLLARRRLGMDLACVVLLTDATANGWAIYGPIGGGGAARVGHAVVTLLALGSLAARAGLAPYLRPPPPARRGQRPEVGQ